MSILKEDQKRHSQGLSEKFFKLRGLLKECGDLIVYFYGEDSEEYKDYREKAQSFFEMLRDIRSNINKKHG